MSTRCESPVPVERLVDYLSGDLSQAEEEALEAHLFGCEMCGAEAAKLGGVVAAVAGAVPPILSSGRLASLEKEGRVGQTNVMAPGQTARVFYPEAGKVLVHRLECAELSDAPRVDVDLRTLDGTTLTRMEDVPFDPSKCEVILACQSHFAETFPHDLIFALQVVERERRAEVASYTILHALPARDA